MTTPTIEGVRATVTTQTAAAHAAPKRRLVTPIVIAVAAIAALAIGGLTNDMFLTGDNILAILRSAAITGIVALGATFITISGRFFSLALGQTAVFSAVLLAVCMRAGLPFIVAFLITVLAAIIWGVAQGAVISLGANPIITTLGAGALLAALSGLMTDGNSIRIVDGVSQWVGSARPVGIPIQTLTFLALIVVAVVVMQYTRLGRATVLVGANRATADAAGISIWRVTIAAFALASMAAALAGVFGASQFGQARISEFSGLDFDVVAAVLIGGTAIQGGYGSPLRSALGAVFIAVVQNYMLLLGLSHGVRTVVLGGLVLAAVIIFHLVNRRSRGMS